MGAPMFPTGGTAPSYQSVRAHFDRLAALSRSHPSHALVRPARVRGGAVLDAVTPLDPDTRMTARDHYRGGGVVRLHGRRPADLATATTEIRQ